MLYRHFYGPFLPVVNISEEDYAQLEGLHFVWLFPVAATMNAFGRE